MKKYLVVVAVVVFAFGFVSCEPESTAEDTTYEFNAIDGDEVEDPDDRGNQ